jgi:NAD(P)-dependent dehydrogenase (short-subunit alcohol dehydrogenase family)
LRRSSTADEQIQVWLIKGCRFIGGLIGIAGRAAHHASKHGVIGLTKSAALEYASRGIRINAVCPGTIDAPMVTNVLAKELEGHEGHFARSADRATWPARGDRICRWLCSPGGGPTYAGLRREAVIRIWSNLSQDVQNHLFQEAVTSQGESIRSQLAVFLHEHPRTLGPLGKPREMTEPDSLGG